MGMSIAGANTLSEQSLIGMLSSTGTMALVQLAPLGVGGWQELNSATLCVRTKSPVRSTTDA